MDTILVTMEEIYEHGLAPHLPLLIALGIFKPCPLQDWGLLCFPNKDMP